jgi:hypothetical protein
MMKLILGMIVLISLAGCDQNRDPFLGSWSYDLLGTTVTYTFKADRTCSVAVPDFTTGKTKTLRGTYTYAYPSTDSPPQLSITWKADSTNTALSEAAMTPIQWNREAGGLSISLQRQ